MDRRAFFSRTLVATGAGVSIGLLSACSTPDAAAGVIVAIPLTAKPGKSADDVISAMRPIIAFIRSQKGLLEEVLLGSTSANSGPTHIHFMRWKGLRDWENLSADQKFLQLIEKTTDAFSLQLAETFTKVKI